MNSVGTLVISACYAEGGLSDLGVILERPRVTKLFIGQLPEAVVKTVPYIYTLCAQAQRAAAQAALAAAGDEVPRPADHAALWAEMLHEHLWRLLLDWPQALGLPQARDALVTWRNARVGDSLAAATDRLLRDTLLGVAPGEWQGDPAPASLAARCLVLLGGEKEGGFDLPPLTPEAWLAYWQGRHPCPPLTPRPPSVAVAYRRRLHEAVQAARALQAGTDYPVVAVGGGGWGVGQTLTARGVLTHATRLEDGRVADYRIWAPTDRHFADSQDLQALLGGGEWPDAGRARRALERAVLALDPCLPYELKVNHA